MEPADGVRNRPGKKGKKGRTCSPPPFKKKKEMWHHLRLREGGAFGAKVETTKGGRFLPETRKKKAYPVWGIRSDGKGRPAGGGKIPRQKKKKKRPLFFGQRRGRMLQEWGKCPSGREKRSSNPVLWTC